MSLTNSDAAHLRELIPGMRAALARGENMMAYARHLSGSAVNLPVATLVAYDLQAGSYAAAARRDPPAQDRWCGQLAELLAPLANADGSLLEVGCGEATTLAGVLAKLPSVPRQVLGFDLSWSRCAEGLRWLESREARARLFVADLFSIPLDDASVDVVYTSHSLEPNGGREEAALGELLRITRRALVLVEPIYELSNDTAQARMRQHGYVRGLRGLLDRHGCRVTDYRLLPYSKNPLNPSGVIVVEKSLADGGGGGARVPVSPHACAAGGRRRRVLRRNHRPRLPGHAWSAAPPGRACRGGLATDGHGFVGA